jgi:hypothetical protein
MWQDYLILICNIVFSYALIPTIIHNYKKKRSSVQVQTAFLTTLGLVVVGATYITLKLYLSTAISFVMALLWLILLIQSISYK